jgi:hypothetical protein
MDGRANRILIGAVGGVALLAAALVPAIARAEEDLYHQLLGCVTAAAAIRGSDPEMTPKLFAYSCRAPCGGFAKYAASSPSEHWKALGDGCDLFCSGRSRTAFEAAPVRLRWYVLANICGAAYYGLPPGQESLLSDAWFVVQRSGAWLSHARSASDAMSKRALADIESSLRVDPPFGLAMPAAAMGFYTIPFARVAGEMPAPGQLYVAFGRGKMSVGRVPDARLSIEGARLSDRLPAPQAQRLDDLAAMLASLPKGPSEEVTGTGLDRAVHEIRANGRLVFADEKLPVDQLERVIDRIGGIHLAVSDQFGAAKAHSVVLATDVHDPAEMHLTMIRDREAFYRQAKAAAQSGQLKKVLWLDVHDKTATVSDLAVVMDEAYRVGVLMIVLPSEKRAAK